MASSGGAPGPPQAINDVIAEQDTHYTREVHALVILALVVIAFLIIVGLLYFLHWLCVLTRSISYRESFASQKSAAEVGELPEEPVEEAPPPPPPPPPVDEDKIMSHSEQISESDSAKRCYPSQELTFELSIPKTKRPSQKEAPAPVKVLRPAPDYSAIVLKNNQMYVGGLSKRPRDPPSYLSTLEKPGTQTPVFASQSVSGTMIATAKPPYSKSYKIVDKMKIANAPILTAPKKSTSGSMKTAVEGPTSAVPGQAVRQGTTAPTPSTLSMQSTQTGTPPAGNTPMSTAKNVTPVSIPYTRPGLKITGQSSVRTAPITGTGNVDAVVKITAAPVSISAMRRKPLPESFKPAPIQPQDVASKTPLSTPLQTAKANTPKSETSVSMSTKSANTSETSTKTS